MLVPVLDRKAEVPCTTSGHLARREAEEERKDGWNRRTGFGALDRSARNSIKKI